MRSLLLVRPPDGGVGDHASSTAREFERRGFDVRQLTLSREPGSAWRGIALALSERRRLRRSELVQVEFGRLDAGVFWFALAASAFRRDLVAVAHDAPTVVLAPAAALVPGRSVWSERLGYRVLGPLLDRPLRRLFARRIGSGAVLTERAATAWRAAGAERVALVRHGADAPSSRPVPPSSGSYVLFAGFIGPSKGLDVLLDAWPDASSGSTLELVIAGGSPNTGERDPYLESMHERATALPRVRWLGAVDDATFSTLLAEAAVVCLPYRLSNPASGILVRAMVEGRAIIATSVPAVDDAIGQDEALIVPPGDADALAVALRRTLDDPELRDRLGAAAGGLAARQYTWAGTVDDLLAVRG